MKEKVKKLVEKNQLYQDKDIPQIIVQFIELWLYLRIYHFIDMSLKF